MRRQCIGVPHPRTESAIGAKVGLSYRQKTQTPESGVGAEMASPVTG